MTDSRQILDEIPVRIKKVREDMGYSPGRMAELFGITRSGYVKYEAGHSYPRPQVMFILTRDFDISLDWLISGKGPMYYKEKEQPESKPEPEPVLADVRELFQLMESIPLLRYQVLTLFSQFKLEHDDLIQSAMKPADESAYLPGLS
ncbi:helix-turn-helix domain-containing protein [Acidobacteriota bacterium]